MRQSTYLEHCPGQWTLAPDWPVPRGQCRRSTRAMVVASPLSKSLALGPVRRLVIEIMAIQLSAGLLTLSMGHSLKHHERSCKVRRRRHERFDGVGSGDVQALLLRGPR